MYIHVQMERERERERGKKKIYPCTCEMQGFSLLRRFSLHLRELYSYVLLWR